MSEPTVRALTTCFWFEQPLDQPDPAFVERLLAFAAEHGCKVLEHVFPPMRDDSKPARRSWALETATIEAPALITALGWEQLEPEAVEIDGVTASLPEKIRAAYRAACDAAERAGLTVYINDPPSGGWA